MFSRYVFLRSCMSTQISGDITGGAAVWQQYSCSIAASFAFKLIPTKAKRSAGWGKGWSARDLPHFRRARAEKIKERGFMGICESLVTAPAERKDIICRIMCSFKQNMLPLRLWLSPQHNNHPHWPMRVNITAPNSIGAYTHSLGARQWIIQQGQDSTACQERK